MATTTAGQRPCHARQAPRTAARSRCLTSAGRLVQPRRTSDACKSGSEVCAGQDYAGQDLDVPTKPTRHAQHRRGTRRAPSRQRRPRSREAGGQWQERPTFGLSLSPCCALSTEGAACGAAAAPLSCTSRRCPQFSRSRTARLAAPSRRSCSWGADRTQRFHLQQACRPEARRACSS